ncbi:MAG TPA: hypothetical protein PLV03_00890 [Clostridiales bacterium]|nr:hypothetical protein [Clostridiales bacterium]HPR76148.1 hypothetical protein [Oscillospiraceae bacterium]
MVKGVNKQVIEVVDTGSRYFERAILIVNPKNIADQTRIYDEAARIFSKRQEVPPLKKTIFPTICKMAGFTALGAAIAGILIKVF